MNLMKLLLFFALIFSIAIQISMTQVSRAATPEKPNIIFFLADDLGPGDIGPYGGKIAPTPNLDRLMRGGTKFTQFYQAAPICSPSRCGLITGSFPARWNITSYLQTKKGNRECEQADYLDAKAPSLPRVLQEAGYATAHIGKWHLGGGRDVKNMPPFAAYGYDEGVGTWESPQPHPDITATDWIWSPQDKFKRWERTRFFVDKSLDFLARHQNKPCFINLWPDDVHTPWVPGDGDGALPKGDTREKLKRVVIENDKQIGRLMDNLPPNTLLIYASDNGPLPTFKGERATGLRGSKLSLYEGGIRLPFMAYWPGHVPAAKTDDSTLICGVDMLPTLATIGGAKLPDAALDGENLSAALLGTPQTRKQPLFWEYGRNNQSFAYPPGRDRSPNVAMREGNWKLLINADGSEAELYDLQNDPNEEKNLTKEQPEIATRLSAAALAWRQSLPKLPK